MTRQELVLQARRDFVAWNNAFEPDQVQLDADDETYFYSPEVSSDTRVPVTSDRILVVYQGLNDELHSVCFIILTDEDYSEIKGLIVEADTNYSVVKELK